MKIEEKALCETRDTVVPGVVVGSPCHLIATSLPRGYEVHPVSVAYIVSMMMTFICFFDEQTRIITGKRIRKWKMLFRRER